MNLSITRFGLLTGALLCISTVACAQVKVLTNRYDNARTGANLSETQLNASNVSVNNFGKLWSYTVDGSVQAQPLYVPSLKINNATRNALYIVTMNDKLYGFDADSNATLWCDSFTSDTSGGCTNPVAVPSGTTPVPITDIVGPNLNISGNVGILSTPVIDGNTNTMYLVARTKETGSPCGVNLNGNSSYCQRLHAIDVTTGAEKPGGPTIIGGSFLGITFDPWLQNQRPSLALANGQIFIAWASHEDRCLDPSHDAGCNGVPYHGWVMSYDAGNLKQTGIFCVTPSSPSQPGPQSVCASDSTGECGRAGGVWQSGRAPAVDSTGNVYYLTGNGGFDGGFHGGGNNYGESLLKFSSLGGLALVDYFTPSPWANWNSGDTDFSSSGPLLVPGTNLIVSAGKSSTFYLSDTLNLAGLENTQDVQPPFPINGGEVKGGPVYWNRAGGVGPWMYVWAENDFLKAFHFNGSTFDTSPVSQSTIQAPTSGNATGVLTLSANASTPGTGIVWSSMALEDADHGVHPGILRALNADDLSQAELWDSKQNQARDDAGLWPKFSPPSVVNGKVYMASFSGFVSVYGLFDFTLSAGPASVTVNPAQSATYTINTASVYPSGFPSNVTYSVTGLPPGATSSFSANGQAVPGTSTLTVITASSTPPGTYTLAITGAGGIQTHSATVTLVVTYKICLLYDPTFAKKSGSTYPVKLQICDANGNNLSSSSIVLQAQSVTLASNNALGVLDDSGAANPDFDFRFDSTLPGYIFNLSLIGVSAGTYNLNFTVTGDPVTHSAQFRVR